MPVLPLGADALRQDAHRDYRPRQREPDCDDGPGDLPKQHRPYKAGETAAFLPDDASALARQPRDRLRHDRRHAVQVPKAVQ